MGGLFNFLARGAGLILGAEAVQEATERLNAGARPVLKSAIRAGMSAGERLETWTAGAREQFEDLIEEARAEHQREEDQRGR